MTGSWRLNKDRNILTSPAPLDIAVCLLVLLGCSTVGLGLNSQLRACSHCLISNTASSSELQLLNRESRGPPLLGAVLSTASYLQLSIGGPEGPLCWVLFSLHHPFSNCLELPVHRVILLFYTNSISSHNWLTEYAPSAVFGMACLIVIERK